MAATAEREKTSHCKINALRQADVENNANKGTKICFGLAETSFKARFANHSKDFNHEQYKKAQNCQSIDGC